MKTQYFLSIINFLTWVFSNIVAQYHWIVTFFYGNRKFIIVFLETSLMGVKIQTIEQLTFTSDFLGVIPLFVIFCKFIAAFASGILATRNWVISSR